MSFILAGFVLLLSLLASIVLDDIGGKRWQRARRDIQLFDVW